jgi:DNA-binding response OmpR family regulator
VLLLSEPGRGTSVEVYLPAAEAEAPAESAAAAAAVERSAGTVLVVEDDEQVRHAACASLERSGFRALLAANGDEALAIARGHSSIDAVLADLVLPGIGGREVARQIAALRPGVPVVLMSGHAGEAANAGDEVLEKPFTQRALVAKMQAVLRRGHAKR